MNILDVRQLPASIDVLRARVQLAAISSGVRAGGATAVFAAAVACIYFGFRDCQCFDLQYDDAYITFRYAHNLASGNGLVFNVGDPTDSASSFLYTVLLAALERAGMSNIPRAAALIGVACAATIGVFVYLACLERTRRPFLAMVLGWVVGTHGLISGWSLSGMETLFYSALVSAAVYRVFVVGKLTWVEAWLVFAAVLTRFEGVMLAAAWSALTAYVLVRGEPVERKRAWFQLTAMALGFAAFLGLKLALYGTVIPHAFALKTITQIYAPNPVALWDVWRENAPGLMLLGALGLTTLPRRREGLVFFAYIVVSVAALALGPSADWARYSVHMLPITAILASVPLSRLLQRAVLIALPLIALLGVSSYDSLKSRMPGYQAGAGHARCRAQIGQYLERSLEPGTLVLSSDIGVIAYNAPSIRFVDAVGLTSKDVLQARLRGQNLDAVLLAAKPVVLADTCGGGCSRVEDFAAHNWLTDETYWLTPLPMQRYSTHLHDGKLLDRCRSPDGLSFAASRFELTP